MCIPVNLKTLKYWKFLQVTHHILAKAPNIFHYEWSQKREYGWEKVDQTLESNFRNLQPSHCETSPQPLYSKLSKTFGVWQTVIGSHSINNPPLINMELEMYIFDDWWARSNYQWMGATPYLVNYWGVHRGHKVSTLDTREKHLLKQK